MTGFPCTPQYLRYMSSYSYSYLFLVFESFILLISVRQKREKLAHFVFISDSFWYFSLYDLTNRQKQHTPLKYAANNRTKYSSI